MGKLVVLKFGKGSFLVGFPVLLQLGEENALPTTEVSGELPATPELPLLFNHWQTIYRSLDLSSRPKGLPKPAHHATLSECHQAAEQLQVCLNQWLQSDLFRPIRDKCLERLHSDDSIRVILQTEDVHLQKLPWHLWELLERYPKAEVALSTSHYERREQPAIASGQVKILALFGESSGINLRGDRQTLEQIPNAKVEFIIKPTRQELTNQLWESNWDILFFAGHSKSEHNSKTGKIYINATESLSIPQLKYSLKKAVDQGLRLAIFNSCDGLGLAKEFADLNIPQLIVMREPVPDRIAQLFLKYFLEAFAQGDSLYLAVRAARERLEGMEGQFPCATWLPIICQNPAAVPPTWQELLAKADRTPELTPTEIQSSKTGALTTDAPMRLITAHRQRSKVVSPSHMSSLLGGMAIAALLLTIRHVGLLQPLELRAFDQLMRSRPEEPVDSQILAVTVTEEDIAAQAKETGRGSISEESLAKLLDTLSKAKPSVIGLDIYRDHPVQQTSPQVMETLTKHLKKDDRFIAICRLNNPAPESGGSEAGVAPPPEMKVDQLGFSDILTDDDGIVRRHLLAGEAPPSSPCLSEYAFSVRLALRYLYDHQISLTFPHDAQWQLGKLKFNPLETRTGGYQTIDAMGSQILLNYRSDNSRQKGVAQVTLSQVLTGKVSPSMIKDRIILIGTSAQSYRDYHYTPYSLTQTKSQSTTGVVLQAQMVSQLINAALGKRSLLTTWKLPQEIGWIIGWSILGGLAGTRTRRFHYWALVNGGAILLLYGSCLLVLIYGTIWIPLVPSAIAFMASSLASYATQQNMLRGRIRHAVDEIYPNV